MEYTKAKQMLLWLWIIAAVLILLNILLWGDAHAKSVEYYDKLTDAQQETAREMEAKYLEDPQDALRFNGDTVVESDEIIKHDIVVVNGTITIEGRVNGTVLCLFGDVELEDKARVRGDVVSVEGIIWTDNGSVVDGDIIETGSSHSRNLSQHRRDQDEDKDFEKDDDKDDYKWKSRDKKDFISINYRYDSDQDDPVFFDYNRVDGLTMGLNFPSSGWWNKNRHDFAILGKAGYSFARRDWQYQIGLEKWFLYDNRFSIGGEYHDLTSTEDKWIISDLENALASLLIKEDFRDYYLKQGYSVYLKQQLTYYLNVKLAYEENEIYNMENKADWAVFGGSDKKFRTNPAALPGGFVEQNQTELEPNPGLELGSISATVVFDTRDRVKSTQRGWYIQGYGERTDYMQLSNTSFDRYIVDARYYHPMGWDENLNIRLRGGTTRGDVPPMYWFDLGGISTLRGYDFKEFTGDRMVLGNVEYRMRTSQDDWFIFDTFDIILFMDSGLAWFADGNTPDRVNAWQYEQENGDDASVSENNPKDSFRTLTWNSLKTNVGIGLATEDDGMRINFAKRTDIGGQDFVVTFRLNHTF